MIEVRGNSVLTMNENIALEYTPIDFIVCVSAATAGSAPVIDD